MPDYSNRDAVYNDLAAPGDAIFSTIPTLADRRDAPGLCRRAVLRLRPVRVPRRDRHVVRSAAGLGGGGAADRPGPERCGPSRSRTCSSAVPTTTRLSTGCPGCPVGRDRSPAAGRSTCRAALSLLTGAPLPPADHYEPNDDAGPWAHALPPLPRTISATLDYWDDDVDVYRVYLVEGQRLYARLTPAAGGARSRFSSGRPERSGSRRSTRRRATLVAPSRVGRTQARVAATGDARPASTTSRPSSLTKSHRRRSPTGSALSRRSPGARRRATSAARAPASRRRRLRGGTSFVTTAPAPTNASSPISIAGAEDRAAADARAASDRRPSHQLAAPLGAAHEVVVRRHDARRDEDVLLERRVRGDVRVRPGCACRRRPSCRSRSASRGRACSRRPSARARGCTTGRRRCSSRRSSSRRRRSRRVETIVPSPIVVGGSGSRFAVERAPSDGCLPTTAFSSTRTPSPSTVPS